jgi:hypothetical protein
MHARLTQSLMIGSTVGRTSGLRSALSGLDLLAGCDAQGAGNLYTGSRNKAVCYGLAVTVCCACDGHFVAGDGCMGARMCCVPGFAAMLIGDVTTP